MTFVAGSVIVDGVAQPAADPEIGFAINNIPAGGTRTVSFKVTVNASLPLINPIQNKSGADFSFLVDPAAPAVQGTPIVSNTVTTQINDSILSATKSVNLAYADVGSILIYTVTVNNTGNISATGVVFTDVPPAGTTFVPGSVIVNGGAVPAANPVTGFTLPSIAAGGTATVAFQASVNGTLPLPTLVSNTATVKAPGKTAVASNAVVTQIRHAQLTAQKQTDTANTDLGAIINYTITLTNVGNTTAQGITFVDAIPSGTSFVGNSVLMQTLHWGYLSPQWLPVPQRQFRLKYRYKARCRLRTPSKIAAPHPTHTLWILPIHPCLPRRLLPTLWRAMCEPLASLV